MPITVPPPGVRPATTPSSAPVDAATPPVTTPVTTPVTAGGTTPAADPAASYGGSSSAPADLPSNARPVPPGAVNLFAARLAAMGGSNAVMAALATDAGRQALAAELSGLMAGDPASAAAAAQIEKQVIAMVAQANAAGKLPELLTLVADQVGGPLAGLPPDKKQAMILQFAGMIDAELSARGMTPDSAGVVYKDWQQLSQEHLSAVRDSRVATAGPGTKSAFTRKAFVRELEALQGARFSTDNLVTPLIDGPASFAERKALIEGASERIHLMTWAFYDDATGWETARMLAAKAQGDPPVEVKIIVDGQVGERPGHSETLKFMEAHGVQVVRWRDDDRKYDGMHRKCMIVDGKAAIAGGMNVGDVYSHGGPADGQKWRDTDVKLQGGAVVDAERLFDSIWNEQRALHNLPVAAIDASVVADAEAKAAATDSSARAAVVNHVPGPDGDAHILLATLKAIEGATESIDIENAYFISTPALRQSLLDALERGVKVRLLTNSAQSVDEPIVTVPILESLPELVDAGAEVYLKQGDTLHSKFLVVDGMYTSVGSYNLHPRSHRYEGEMTVNVIDRRFAKKMDRAFERDIAAATRLDHAADLQIPRTALSTLAGRYFFDQL